MPGDTRVGLLKQQVSLSQDRRPVIQATGAAGSFEFAERNGDRIHAAVGAGAGTVVSDQFDLGVIARSHRGVGPVEWSWCSRSLRFRQSAVVR